MPVESPEIQPGIPGSDRGINTPARVLDTDITAITLRDQ